MAERKDEKLRNLMVVGDRVLIKPRKVSGKTKGGLYLPPGYAEKEELLTGYIVKCGPGYPLASPADDPDEGWKNPEEQPRYIPLQVKDGDLAIFLQKNAIEILFRDEKYFIVPQHAILLIERDEALYD